MLARPLIIFSLLFSAGIPKSHIIESQVTAYFDEFMNEVLQDCDIKQINYPDKIIIGFDKTQTRDAVGECYRSPGLFVIKFDSFGWLISSDEEKRNLTFHEFTHCVLKQDHVSDPSNYMYPYLTAVPKDKLYKQLHEYTQERCHGK